MVNRCEAVAEAERHVLTYGHTRRVAVDLNYVVVDDRWREILKSQTQFRPTFCRLGRTNVAYRRH